MISRERIAVSHPRPLDALLYDRYGRYIKGLTERVLEINTGLCEFEFVPEGYEIILPEVVEEKPRETIKLWD